MLATAVRRASTSVAAKTLRTPSQAPKPAYGRVPTGWIVSACASTSSFSKGPCRPRVNRPLASYRAGTPCREYTGGATPSNSGREVHTLQMHGWPTSTFQRDFRAR
eukprot:scaffold23_cov268-Pinguiococcus_pyrenoidosus.AAC.6